MPKVPVLQRQVSEQPAPVGAKGKLNVHDSQIPKLGDEVAKAATGYAKAMQKQEDIAQKAMVKNLANEADNLRARLVNEAKLRKGYNASGVTVEMEDAFDSSDVVQKLDKLIASRGLSAENAQSATFAVLKSRRGMVTQNTAHENLENFNANKREFEGQVQRKGDDVVNARTSSQAFDSLVDLATTSYEKETLIDGSGSKEGRVRAAETVADALELRWKQLGVSGNWLQIKKERDGLKKGFGEATRGPQSLGSPVSANDIVKALDFDDSEVDKRAEAQKIYEEIVTMDIPEGEKLKMVYEKTTDSQVAKWASEGLRTRMRDIRAASKAAAEERANIRVRSMMKDVKDTGRLKRLDKYFSAQDKKKTTVAEMTSADAAFKRLETVSYKMKSKLQDLKNMYRINRGALRAQLEKPETYFQWLGAVGPAGMKELMSYADKKPPTDGKKKGKRAAFTSGVLKELVKSMVIAKPPVGLGLSGKAYEKASANIFVNLQEFITDEYNRTGENPSRRDVQNYLRSKLLIKPEPEDSGAVKLLKRGLNLIPGVDLEVKEGRPAGWQRRFGAKTPPARPKTTAERDAIIKNHLASRGLDSDLINTRWEQVAALIEADRSGDPTAIQAALKNLGK